MRDLAVLFLHLLATVARLAGPGGVRSVVAESVLVKHQLLILNRARKRSPNLRFADRVAAGLCTLVMRPGRLIRSAIVLKPKRRMRHLIFLVSASVLVVSCNHATPTTPHTTSDGPPMFDFILELPPNSTGYLHGMLMHGSTNGGIQRGLKVGLEAQTHTMEGTLYGSGGIYRFKLWSKEGSLVPGSFKALSGPVERLAPCEVVFVNRTAESGPFPISVQFTVQDSFDGDCHTNY